MPRMMSSRVLRGAFAFGMLLLVACTQGSTPAAPTSTPIPSPNPATLGEEPSNLLLDPGAPDPQSLPETLAPGDLGAVTLPGDADGIVAVFGQLPSQVAGQPRSTSSLQRGPSAYDASYGEAEATDCSPLRLQARDVSTGEFYPKNWTAEVFISWWTIGADWEVEEAGRADDLFWVRWYTFCSSEPSSVVFPIFSLIWGQAGSRWIFTAQADTPEELDALIAAFVTAASD